MKAIRILAVAMAAAFGLAAALPSWACDSMGPNKHVGVIAALDAKAGTVTIIDAQMQKPLTFAADAKLLAGLAPKKNIVVTYKKDGDRLAAEAIAPAS